VSASQRRSKGAVRGGGSTNVGGRRLWRIKLDFVVDLSEDAEMPNPTIEMVDAAALASVGPCSIRPGAKISVGPARVGRVRELKHR